ncbi:MAG: ImmA/IrrE family metallo-endopeptidase [Clostridia bacterium]|nr:ImmA/IrrE family metallo-endopeptidase [Clostridia bacterium]
MKIQLNDMKWEIKETSGQELLEKYRAANPGEDVGYVFGICLRITNEILIAQELSEPQKKRTLIHELMHAWLWTNRIGIENFTEEDICNFTSASYYFINDIVTKYFVSRQRSGLINAKRVRKRKRNK